MKLTREDLAELYRLMDEKVIDSLDEMAHHQIEHIKAKGVNPPREYSNGAIGWVYDDFIDVNYNHWLCGFLDRRSGTFYNVVRLFCTDKSMHDQLDGIFRQFFIDEHQPNTKELFIYGLDMP